MNVNTKSKKFFKNIAWGAKVSAIKAVEQDSLQSGQKLLEIPEKALSFPRKTGARADQDQVYGDLLCIEEATGDKLEGPIWRKYLRASSHRLTLEILPI